MLISETEEMSLTTIVIFTTTGFSVYNFKIKFKIKKWLQILSFNITPKKWSDVLSKEYIIEIVKSKG